MFSPFELPLRTSRFLGNLRGATVDLIANPFSVCVLFYSVLTLFCSKIAIMWHRGDDIMILFPIINIVAGSIVADVWENIGKYVFLAMFLCGVLLPIYVVGKKYE